MIDLAFNIQSRTFGRAGGWLDGSDRSGIGMNQPSLCMVQVHFTHFGSAYAISFLNAVPEPTTLFPLVLAGLLLPQRST